MLLQCALHDRPRLLQVLLCTQTSNTSPIVLQLTQNAPHSERIRVTFRRNRGREDEIRMERLPRYWGKRVEKELTSSMPPSFQDGSNFSIFQWSMFGSSSHGLGLSCFPFRRQFFPSGASAAAAAALASSSDAMAELKRARVSWGLEERSSRMRRGRSPCRLGLVAFCCRRRGRRGWGWKWNAGRGFGGFGFAWAFGLLRCYDDHCEQTTAF